MVEHSLPLATILRKSPVSEGWVLLLLVGVFVLVGAGLIKRLWTPAGRRCVVVVFGLGVLGLAVSAAVWPVALGHLCDENDLAEWLTSHFLLVACMLGVAIVIRQEVRRKPSAVAAILAAGYFFACGREMEWGEPFYGEKVLFSRYWFLPRAWFDPSRFHKIADLTGYSENTLRWMHVASAAVVALIAIGVVWYVIRRRAVLAREIGRMGRALWARYFLATVGAYLLAEGLEVIFKKLARAGHFGAWAQDDTVPGQMVANGQMIAEPLKMLGTVFAAMSVVALWHETSEERDLQSTCG